jgi:hypothetical protein
MADGDLAVTASFDYRGNLDVLGVNSAGPRQRRRGVNLTMSPHFSKDGHPIAMNGPISK